jgi:hypothetical protein
VIILKEHSALKSLCGNNGDETELDMSGKMDGAEDAIMLAAEIIDNRALSELNLASNNLGALVLPEGWTKKDEHFDRTWQEVFTHADGTKQIEHPGKPEGIIALANAIPDMGALSKIIFGGDGYVSKKNGERVKAEPAALEAGMTEANLGNKNLGEGGAIIISAWIAHKDNGALFSVDVGNNDMPADKLQDIDHAVRSNRLRPIHEDSNKSLSEIDLSSRYLDAKDAIVVAEYIKDIGALTLLNLSSNSLKAEGGKIVAEAIKVTNNAMAVVLVPFSCLSDHWLNCCCLLLSTG